MLVDLTVKEFLNKVAGSDPVPGGGSIAALNGAVASALAAMVANLTIGIFLNMFQMPFSIPPSAALNSTPHLRGLWTAVFQAAAFPLYYSILQKADVLFHHLQKFPVFLHLIRSDPYRLAPHF